MPTLKDGKMNKKTNRPQFCRLPLLFITIVIVSSWCTLNNCEREELFTVSYSVTYSLHQFGLDNRLNTTYYNILSHFVFLHLPKASTLVCVCVCV